MQNEKKILASLSILKTKNNMYYLMPAVVNRGLVALNNGLGISGTAKRGWSEANLVIPQEYLLVSSCASH